jgi:fructuronate reductase
VGLLLGRETVAEAMADREIADFIERLMREDIAPAVPPAPGLDIPGYIGAILQRFRNPAIAHKLSQIAWDGSQKLPFRLLQTTAETLAAGRPIGRLAAGPAAWMAFVRRQARAGVPIVDPLAERLAQIGRAATGEPAADVAALLALDNVFPPVLAADPSFRGPVTEAYRALTGQEPRALLR